VHRASRDDVRPDERRRGLQAYDRQPDARPPAIEEVAACEPGAVAAVRVVPPQRGVDDLHAAEDAEEDSVAVGARVAASEGRSIQKQFSGQLKGNAIKC